MSSDIHKPSTKPEQSGVISQESQESQDSFDRSDSKYEEVKSSMNDDDDKSPSKDKKLDEILTRTALHELVEGAGSDENAVKGFEDALKQTNGNINTREPEQKRTALHLACENGYVELARKLLNIGASHAVTDWRGCQPLHDACLYGSKGIVELLIGCGARVDVASTMGGYYPLHYACVAGHEKLIETLLGTENISLNERSGYSKRTPLDTAIFCENASAVDTLLKHNPNIDITNDRGSTPLMTAVQEGYTNILTSLCRYINKPETLEPGRDLHFNIRNDSGMTALMIACAKRSLESVEILLDAGSKCTFQSRYGRTTLHWAAKYSDAAIVSLIIQKMEPKSLSTLDTKAKTPLHLAAKYNDHKTILSILVEMRAKDVLIHDNRNMTALDTVCYRERVLDNRDAVLVAIISHFLKTSEDGHENKELVAGAASNPIEFAACTRRPELLWPVIATSPRTPETREAIENALEWVKDNEKEGIKAQQNDEEEDSRLLSRPRREDKGQRDRKEMGDQGQKQSNNLDKLKDIREILDHFAISQNYRRNEKLELPFARQSLGIKNILDQSEGAVIRFYNNNNKVIRLGRNRKVQDVIYSEGPRNILTDAIKTLRKTSEKYDKNVFKEGPNMPTSSKSYDDGIALYTWIHLPSTNIRWMEDLVKRIMHDGKKSQGQFQGVYQFLRDSWVEVPDRTSASRFMRPRYVERRQDKAEPEGDFIATSAVYVSGFFLVVPLSLRLTYMPYLSHSIYHKEEVDNLNDTDSKRIGYIKNAARNFEVALEAYKPEGTVIHGPPTLDEGYYHFETDVDSADNKLYRNGNQVLTKYIRAATSREDMPCWPLIRVNQVWIWVIDNEWIITSTSQRVDDIRENLATDVLDHLSKQTEKGENQSQPGCPLDLTKHQIHQPQEAPKQNQEIGRVSEEGKCQDLMKPNTLVESSTNTKSLYSNTEDKKKLEQIFSLSIRQVFSHYINATGREEIELFKNFYSRQKNLQSLNNQQQNPQSLNKAKSNQSQKSIIHWLAQMWNHHSEHNVNPSKSISDVTKLFLEVKDIRDELNILKTIAEFQLTVQKALERPEEIEILTSQYVVKDLNQMDGVAKRIQEGANTTLTLEESEVANHQARIAIKQGRTMMIFTVVTIVFLPLSFLSSLFALDVASFQEAPAWALVVIFLVSLAFSLPTAGYALASEKVDEAFQQGWKKIRSRGRERESTAVEEREKTVSEEPKSAVVEELRVTMRAGDLESQHNLSPGQQ